MDFHHIMMLIHHKLYDSYKLYYCRIFCLLCKLEIYGLYIPSHVEGKNQRWPLERHVFIVGLLRGEKEILQLFHFINSIFQLMTNTIICCGRGALLKKPWGKSILQKNILPVTQCNVPRNWLHGCNFTTTINFSIFISDQFPGTGIILYVNWSRMFSPKSILREVHSPSFMSLFCLCWGQLFQSK